MAEKLRHIDVPLTLGIPQDGDKPDLKDIRIKRPNTGTAIALTRLVGRDVAKLVFAGESAPTEQGLSGKLDELKSGMGVDALIDSLLADDKIDGALDIIADLTGLSLEQLEQVDLEDLPALFGALLDFFPALKSAATGDTPETA